MTALDLIKKAAPQIIYGEQGLKIYFKKISQEINSKKIAEICDEIYKRYETFKQNKTRFNDLGLFLNTEIEKLI